MYRAINFLSFGEHRGGMFIAAQGIGPGGETLARAWHLTAEGDDGPLIPSMAAAAVIRNCLAGREPPPGARPATADLELADYEPLFVRRAIHSGFRQDMPVDARAPLYRRLLGEAWDALPEPLRAMHDLDHEMSAAGAAEVERGTSWPARLAAGVIGFPRHGRDIPLTVSFHAQPQGDGHKREHWKRTFAGQAFASTQEEGRGRFERLLCERFGPCNFAMALVCEADRLRLMLRHWTLLGIPMPLALAPRIDAYESVTDGRFRFHVAIAHPLVGLIVRYSGWLVPQR